VTLQKSLDHPFHALLRAAMGPKPLLGPDAIELQAQIF
jgi:hypothetical protein